MASPPGPYLEVAVAAPLVHTLTYAPPPGVRAEELVPGQRLLVPLGNRLVTGFFLGTTSRVPEGVALKEAREILDPAPSFPETLIPFFRWIADYYHHPLGEVIKTALPKGILAKSSPAIILSSEGKKALEPDPPEWLAPWLGTCRIPPQETKKLLGQAARRTIEQWKERGWIVFRHEAERPKIRPKTMTWIVQAQDDGKTQPLKPSEEKVLAILQELGFPEQPVLQREVTGIYPYAGRALKSLELKGLIRREERRVFRDPVAGDPPPLERPARLTPEQEEALRVILPEIGKRRFSPVLLHGVTGSGKTEVYLRAAAHALDQGCQVIVLVPEIALAAQLEWHFVDRFGDLVAILHSGMSAGERFDQWCRLSQGEARIALGARSAVFAPLADVGLIIVDEEHDPAYKQEDGFRYNGRDLALLRGSLEHACVLLGSATPSVTTRYRAAQGMMKQVRLTTRVASQPLPRVTVVDLKKVPTVSGKPPIFSPMLFAALKENLNSNHQSLIFLNRRGFASLVICRECGKVLTCPNCQVSLTLHRREGLHLCHYCGFSLPLATLCPNCRSTALQGVGMGTERIEAELKRLFPQAMIKRLDRDTAANRAEYLATLKAMHQGEVDILVGTQMITKGHHFPGVTLVGIVWADAGLAVPDFKAAERTFQLLVQVTGRAGRGEAEGRVIIQTHQPEHYSIQLAQLHDDQAFFEKELALRKRLGFPPFGRLINVRFEGKDAEAVKEVAQAAGRRAQREATSSVAVLGPSPAPLARIRQQYRWQLLLKGKEIAPLHALACRVLEQTRAQAASSKVKMLLDVDPESML